MNKGMQRGLRKIYEKKDVFEQDVGTIKVTRVLDPVPQTCPLRHSAMGQTATHEEKATIKCYFNVKFLLPTRHRIKKIDKICLSICLHATSEPC